MVGTARSSRILDPMSGQSAEHVNYNERWCMEGAYAPRHRSQMASVSLLTARVSPAAAAAAQAAQSAPPVTKSGDGGED